MIPPFRANKPTSSSASPSSDSWRWLWPTPDTSARLFVSGATIGPLVDGLHNQCLLEYNVAPLILHNPMTGSALESSVLLSSSWVVPPLLGMAYVVLGGILPRLVRKVIVSLSLFSSARDDQPSSHTPVSGEAMFRKEPTGSCQASLLSLALSSKAAIAVATTAAIIKLSDVLERSQQSGVVVETWSTFASRYLPSLLSAPTLLPDSSVSWSVVVLILAALAQWIALDGTLTALIGASIVFVLGPLSEIPFVAANIWTYLPEAADYFPLKDLRLLGDNGSWYNSNIALARITGPCYFAVTMDAIALGRWFDIISERNAQQD